MSPEIKKEIQLEIAHVLFIDIVGYSKRSINEQRAAVDELTQIVRAAEQFARAEAASRLIKIPTGDGMALVFYTSPEAPAQCAVEISRALKGHPSLQLRMGVHSGPVSGVIDVTGRANLAGAGLNIAQRVMSCADAGHILLSKHVTEDLEEYEHWRPFLHDLGTCEVKHGVRIGVVSLYDNGVGNPQLPKKFQALKKRRTHVRWAEATIALLVLGAVVAAFVLVLRRPARSTLAAPEQSIAVLPFENLSRDPDNAYFATGIQDEILTRLAKIGALKVIARTSTQQYAARPGNLFEIARQLAVANILEGSVQKAADKVHINVQLIRAATDEHLWAESYDRKLENIFGVEAEVATAVAEALRAKLTGAEQRAVELKPTNNPGAYDAYLRGRALAADAQWDRSKPLEAAIQSFQTAVKLDPRFTLAWAYLSYTQSDSYWTGLDPTPERLAAAKDAVDHALALDPNLPETHLALGYYRYYGQRDFIGALAEFEQAEQGLPNNVDVIFAISLIQRRLGHLDEAIAKMRHVVELDPRNIEFSTNLEETYGALRRFPEALAIADRILAFEPTNRLALWRKAAAFWATGDLNSAERLVANPGVDPLARGMQALFQRGYAAAIDILSKTLVDAQEWEKSDILFNLAVAQERAGDAAAARGTYQRAAQELQRRLEKVAPGTFQEAELDARLGRAYAGLGDAASAVSEGQKAMALQNRSKDPFGGPKMEEAMACIYALLGDADHAIPILKRLLQTPYVDPITPALLRIDPRWDQIRNDPRFQELAAEKQGESK